MIRILSYVFLVLVLSGCVSANTIKSINYYDKKEVSLQAETFLVGNEAKPTVLVLHGSGGVDSHHRDWAKTINSWGYNAVVFDSFRPRGISDVNGRPLEVPFLQRAIDAEMVARWTLNQSWSNGKLCVIGFSHGGVAVLTINMKGQLSNEMGSNHSFQCGVNYYGIPLMEHFLSEPTMPVQIHVGSNDGSNDLYRNIDFAKKYKSQTELYVYQNAEHGFDRVATDIRVRGTPGLVKGGYYTIKSDPKSREESLVKVKEFFDKHLN